LVFREFLSKNANFSVKNNIFAKLTEHKQSRILNFLSQDNILKFTRLLRQFLGQNNLKDGGKSKDSCSNKQWEDEGPESKVVADLLTFEIIQVPDSQKRLI
jgi:hypothetical protein